MAESYCPHQISKPDENCPICLRAEIVYLRIRLADVERAAAEQAYARGVVEAERDERAKDLAALRDTLRHLVQQIGAVLPP